MVRVLKSAVTKEGRKIELISNSETVPKQPVLIIGVFHGDEPQGKYLIEEYLQSFSPLEIKDFGPPASGGHEVSESNMSPLEIEDFGSTTSGGNKEKELPLYNKTFSEEEFESSSRMNRSPKNIYLLSKNLRNNMTKTEVILWQYLRNRKLRGLKFRRQVVIDNYICDFVNFDYRIIIELDGGQHNSKLGIAKDIERDIYLRNNGFIVLRFWNTEVLNDIDGVISKIEDTINKCPPLAGGPKSLISRGLHSCSNSTSRGLIFIPCLNPDGMAANKRTNSNGVDLNRNFPTKNWGEDGSAAGKNASDYFGGSAPASEIETQFLIKIIKEYNPRAILTLHAPYKVVNYDWPAKELAEKISEIIGYPAEGSIGYPTPGSFGTYAGVERNIPTITLELDEKCSIDDLLAPIFLIFELLDSQNLT